MEKRFASATKRYIFDSGSASSTFIFPKCIKHIVKFEEGIHYYDSYCIEEMSYDLAEDEQGPNERLVYNRFRCYWCMSAACTTKMSRIFQGTLYEWKDIDVCGVCFIRTRFAK